MRRSLTFGLVTGSALVLLALLWMLGIFDALALWAAGEQRSFQNMIARTLRGLRAGTPGALAVLMGACFAYGFVHAVGPGHGKVLIGGYGLARQVSWLRLSLISLAASLGQAVTAIALVLGGVWLLGLGRVTLTATADQIMAPVSVAAIGLIGLWLLWRGLRQLDLFSRAHQGHAHQGDEEICRSCGHAHGPSPAQLASATSWRETTALIVGIAIRPCTGALFVLLITWQMGIIFAGIMGTLAMACGTALVTIASGLAASALRGGLLGAGASIARIVPMIEIIAGLCISVIAGGMLLRFLG